MPDRLVATGNKAVDSYLTIARAMLVPQRTLENAKRRLDDAQKADHKQHGFGGTAEARQRAERRYDEANRGMQHAWRSEKAAAVASATADFVMHERATASISAMRRHFDDLRPFDRSDDVADKRPPSDRDRWLELEPGDQIHITYRSGRAMTWTFLGLAGPHPETPRLDVARYTEQGTWRDPAQVRELAAHPDDHVSHVHLTAHTVTISRMERG
ncbi:hypothetical protein ABZ897_51135 [Nonomuraea sp. NPDC046802]|uniref:hypothetical protein n=1 Tax=Nonomuraea sp. NPDC046802 TaxID=3154919 RepID=UPI0033FAD351